MKLKQLNFLLLFALGLSLFSCSDEGEHDEGIGGATQNEIYIEDVKQVVSAVSITHQKVNSIGEEELTIGILGDVETSRFSILSCSFRGIDCSTLKVGDDLVSKSNVEVEYFLILNNGDGRYLMGKNPQDNNGKPIYVDYIGKAIITDIDTSKRTIAVELKGITLVSENQTKTVKLRGKIFSTIKDE